MLTLEEVGRAKKAAQSSSAALVARSSKGPPDVPDNSSSNHNSNSGKKNHNRSNNGGTYRGNNRSRGGGKEATSSDGNTDHGGQLGGGNSRGTGQQSTGQNPLPYSPWTGGQQCPWMASWGSWAIPSCPYPSTSWSRPNYEQQQPPRAGVLGPRPQQAYTTAPTPTDIEAAMHTLGITPPDANRYMDTSATSHMTSTQGFSEGETGNEV
ncbi:uncharacterized protein LOC129894749 [Solanum dulcamara]|uniref:uncharacterized protein LOC129894749 n=1 Tax=Solanum dulcamara TaxID=45834 RepID=UPI002484F87D|nr:uncharacterized protein LOC129894749 [Solanum dulcamara]